MGSLLHRNVNACLNWEAASRALELPLTSLLLPTATICPSCGGRLRVFQDSTAGGCWHHCSGCGRCGDAVELAATCWKLSLGDAARKLQSLGALPAEWPTEEIVAHAGEWPAYRDRLRKTWEQCRRNRVTKHASTVSGLLKHLGLSTWDMSPERLFDGPARFCGSGTIHWLERRLQPGSWVPSKRRSGTSNHIFEGPGWRSALVVPHWAAPGLLCGFSFVGRRGEPADRFFWPADDGRPRRSREAGLAGLDVVVDLPFDVVVGVGDPLLMAQCQTRQLRESLQPLPLVAWHDSPRGYTQDAWATLHGRRLVLWDPVPTAATFEQARRTGAAVTTRGPAERRNMSKFLRDDVRRMPELIQLLTKQSRPWEDALRRLLKAGGPLAERLPGELALRDESWLDVLRDLKVGTPRRLWNQALIAGSVQYVERPQGLFAMHTLPDGNDERQLLNMLVRIDRIHRRRGGVLEYVGRLISGERSVPWRMTPRMILDFEASLRCVADAAKLPLTIRPRASLLDVVVGLHPPPIVDVDDHIGWTGQDWQFRNFRIYAGKVWNHPYGWMPAKSPGPRLKTFKFGRSMAKRLSQEHPAVDWGWGLSMTLLASVLAPQTGWSVPGVLVVAEDCPRSLHDVLERLGLFPETSVKAAERHRHGWPYLLRAPKFRPQTTLQNLCTTNVWSLVEPRLAYATSNFWVVDWPFRLQELEVLKDVPFIHAVLAYLRAQASTKAREPDDQRCPLLQVRDRLERWLHGRVPTATLDRAMTYVNKPTMPGDGDVTPRDIEVAPRDIEVAPRDIGVTRLIAALYAQGQLRPGLTTRCHAGRGGVTVPFQDGELQVSPEALQAACSAAGLILTRNPPKCDRRVSAAELTQRTTACR